MILIDTTLQGALHEVYESTLHQQCVNVLFPHSLATRRVLSNIFIRLFFSVDLSGKKKSVLIYISLIRSGIKHFLDTFIGLSYELLIIYFAHFFSSELLLLSVYEGSLLRS